MTAAIIAIDQLVVQTAARTLLQVPRLRIEAGERVAIVGPNGAGKSTLLRVLNGFVRPAAGRVCVLGRELTAPLRAAPLRALRAEIGQVHQGLHLVSRLSARENVLIGALARMPGWRGWARLYPSALRAEADAALAGVGLLARADERVDRLSGGERQKISIARLRLQHPRLILADEPTANLDPAAAEEACGWLRAAADAAPGITLVTVVHQPALLPRLADRVIGLQAGRIVLDRACDAAHFDDLAGELARLYAPAARVEHFAPAPTSVMPWLAPLPSAHADPP
ncbi:MAG: ATP-binding cassette domain-containing protein [Burkholderiales bacterium]|nr:ATP-binding cassette domain-containing protein [Burkholderiales bacterium]